MYKLNAVLMVVLSLAVIGMGVYLGMDKSKPNPNDEMTRLIRLLGDTDPDVRRDAEGALKAMKVKALPALRDVAAGKDEVLASRAKLVIQQIEGAPVVVKSDKPEKQPEEVAPAVVEIVITAAQQKVAAGDVKLYARLHNGTPQAVFIARHKLPPANFYGEFAAFEITAEDGATLVVPVDHCPRGAEPELEIVAIGAGQTTDLYPGQDLGAALAPHLQKPGHYRVRLVYDAQESSAYQQAIALRHPTDGVPLRAERLMSNVITITVQ
jgi:hypothetical protein